MANRIARGAYAMQQFAADVVAFMDAMGIYQATIVGHSMGSFVAQHVAVAAPERVKRLVLSGSATTVRNSVVSDLQREVNALKDPIPEKFVRDFQVGMAFQPLTDEFVNTVVKESLTIPARVWREVMAEMLSPKARPNLRRSKCRPSFCGATKKLSSRAQNKIDSLRPCQMHG